MTFRTSPRLQAFTLVELLVVIGIITVLLAILLPALNAARERARRIKCASNLHQIDLALRTYAQDNRGRYPRGIYDPSAPHTAFSPTPMDRVRRGPNDTTAPLFLLVRFRLATLDVFVCPSSNQVKDTLDGKPLEQVWNFTPSYGAQPFGSTLSYSLADPVPYTGTDSPPKSYRPPPNVAPDFAVAADRNDSLEAFLASAPNPSPDVIRAANSSNHGQAGQNVLYNDGHVIWSSTPLCGHNYDNIFDGDGFQGTRSSDTPAHKDDSVLLPSWFLWRVGH
jgi:prepilin-type N-terminal cleavage/methylation domain-containing protein